MWFRSRLPLCLRLLPWLLAVCGWAVRADVCPGPGPWVAAGEYWDKETAEECICPPDGHGFVIVDCSSRGFSRLPDRGFPNNSVAINFKNNRIKHLPSVSFPDLPHIETINMDMNELWHMEYNVFRGLTGLSHLRLEHNNLTIIESQTFADLVGLTEIYLKHAGLETVAYNAFYFMPDLDILELADNSLYCDCETKRLRDWIIAAGISKVTWPRCRGRHNVPLIEFPEHSFPNCTAVPAQSCVACTSTSVQSCLQQASTTCLPADDSCQLTVDVIAGQQTVTSHCQRTTECVAEVRSNGRTCLDGQLDQHCNFCCTGHNCTAQIWLRGYTYRTMMEIEFEMGRPYMEEYGNKQSQEYTELALEVTTKIDTTLSEIEDLTLSAPTFTRTSRDYTHCELESESIWPLAATLEHIQATLYSALDRALDLGDLDLDITNNTLVVAIPDYCPPEVEITDKGEFHWPTTRANSTAFAPCPFPIEAHGNASRLCKYLNTAQKYVAWEDSDQSDCVVPSDVTKKLKDLLTYPITNDSVSTISAQLYSLTTHPLTSTDLEYTSQLLHNIVTAGVRMDQTSADNMVGTYNNVIAANESVLQNAQKGFGAIERSLLALDLLSGSLLAAPPNGTITKDSVTFGALRTLPNITEGVVFYISHSDSEDFTENDVTLAVNQSTVDPATTDASLAIPGSVLAQFGGNLPTIQFVGFSDGKLFEALDVEFVVDGKSSNATSARIMAATFGGKHVSHLPEPVTITFRHKHKDAQSPVCVFWDFNASSTAGAWSARGCRVSGQGEGYTVCECDHLTNFALLMDIYGTAANLSDAHQLALSVISYFGCSVSLVCLCATLVTYCVFRKLHKENPAKILMNLCSALIMVMVLFMVVTGPAVRENQKACQAMAGLLHYFLIATWVWMAVEAFYMYLTLIKIFNTYVSKFLLKCSLVGWGVPAVVVIITVSITTDNYGNQGDICWLSRNAFYGACLAPILLILLGNFVVFGLVLNQIRRLSARSAERAAKHWGLRAQLRGACAVVVLLGLTWIFSVFAFSGAGVAFHYLFTIFNSLQGLFIFVFYCLLKKDVREAWRDKWSEVTSSTGSSADKGTRGGTTSSTGPAPDHGPPSPHPTLSTLDTPGARAKTARGDGSVSGSSEHLNQSETDMEATDTEQIRADISSLQPTYTGLPPLAIFSP